MRLWALAVTIFLIAAIPSAITFYVGFVLGIKRGRLIEQERCREWLMKMRRNFMKPVS